MHDGHGPTRSARPDLFAKYTILSLRDRRVIKTARINGNLIPMADRSSSIQRVARALLDIRLSGFCPLLKLRTERVIESAAQSFRLNHPLPLQYCQRAQQTEARHNLASVTFHISSPYLK